MFKHVVAGCDGSPEGRDAVALGAAIASATGARMSLLAVFPTSFFPVPGITDRRTVRAEAIRNLRHDRELLAPEAITHAVADNSVPRALRHYAEHWHADLVVLGSSAAADEGRAAIGRRGRQLLYDAPFSLCVAARGVRSREHPLGRIGVGFDGSPEADAALGVASGLAQAVAGQLTVRRVLEDRVPLLRGEDWFRVIDWSHEAMWEQGRRDVLAETEAAISRLGLGAEVSATVGDPGYELRRASELVDLLVVGSRRWGPLARLTAGGAGETLVSDAGCSVLIVPRPAVIGAEESPAISHQVAV